MKARAALSIATLACFSAAALAQQNRSHSFGPDQCGPADPAYIRTASETGGIPLFLQRSEAAKAFQLVRESTRDNVSLVTWATGTLAETPRTIAIPVDSVTRRITITLSVNTKGTRLALRSPSGEIVAQGRAGTEITELNCGSIVTISAPQTGLWHAEIAGSGTYWLSAEAQADLYFIKSEFVRLGGRIGHQGLFRIPGQPLAGEPATLSVSLSATEAKTIHIRLAGENGEFLQEVQLKPENDDRSFLDMVGTVNLPKVPFRIAVEGTDAGGHQYQRFYSALFHAETVEVAPELDFDELAPGTTRRAAFLIRNIGPANTFRITATDARHFLTNVEPRELSLGSGESATVHMDVTVPVGTAVGVDDDLVVVASSLAPAGNSNSSVVHLSVSSAAQEH